MDFNLKNFSKPLSEEIIPNWVVTPTTKKLYLKVIEHYNIILNQMQESNNLPIRARTLTLRKIAIECNVSPSTLTERRQPDLTSLIKDMNENLSLEWDRACQTRSSSGKKPSRQQLLANVKELTGEVQRLSNLNLSNALSAAIENMLTEEVRLQAHTIRQLKLEVARLNKVVENQADMLQQHIIASD